MKNMDELVKQKAEIVAKINQAVKDGNEESLFGGFFALHGDFCRRLS